MSSSNRITPTHPGFAHHIMRTTLEAAEDFGRFESVKQATAFLKKHDLEFSEALADLGSEDVLDAVTLCRWIGY